MKHLENSLAALRACLDSTPKDELTALISKIDGQAFGGPTVDEYLLALDDALRMDTWLESWPAMDERPEGNWGFQKLTKVNFSSNVIVCPSPSKLENDEDFYEATIFEAA